MTARDVKNYRFLGMAIRKAMEKVDDLREIPYLADKVTGSNPDYPYEERSFHVGGISEMQYIISTDRLNDAVYECQRLLLLKEAIEHACSVIEDEFDKTIWIETMNGKTQCEIAEILSSDQKTVSRRLIYLCEIFTDNS